jgi:hypothetical protein
VSCSFLRSVKAKLKKAWDWFFGSDAETDVLGDTVLTPADITAMVIICIILLFGLYLYH